MEKDKVIKWLESNCWEKWSDGEYRYLMNYAEYIFDWVYLTDDKIELSWEEWYWGGIEYKKKEFDNFEEFKEFYETK